METKHFVWHFKVLFWYRLEWNKIKTLSINPIW